MQIMQAKAANRRGFPGLCGLLLSLLMATAGWSQSIEFLPGAPSTYEAGGVAGTNISIIVTRTPASGVASVEYTTFEGSAFAGQDYIATNGTLDFADGETFKVINVPIIDDALTEPSETFGVLLFNPIGASLGTNTAVLVTIFDNDTFFRFAVTNVVVLEDGTNVVFTVQRNGDTNGAASVDFATVDGTAIFTADYLSTSGTILFTNGQLAATITIPIVDDCTVESNEFFRVLLSNPIGGSVSPDYGAASAVIVDNDTAAGRARFLGAIINSNPDGVPSPSRNLPDPLRPFVRESNTVTITVRVLRECGFEGALRVDITNNLAAQAIFCQGDTNARRDLDWSYVPTGVAGGFTLEWAGGPNDNPIREFDITVLTDEAVELDETVIFSLLRARVGNTPASIGIPSTLPVTIRSANFPAGGVDPFYNRLITAGANSEVHCVSVITNSTSGNNGKSLVAGDFTSVNAAVRNRIARMNQNGLVDQTFQPGSGADGFVSSVAQQADGKILVGGGFNSLNNVSSVGIGRLNEDGSPDATFQPGTGVRGAVDDIAIQEDGRIIIVGEFDHYNDVPVRNIARLHPNGSLDLTFDPGTGPNARIWSVALGAGLYLGGDFTVFDGVTRGRIVRLLPDGAVDPAFAPAFGANDGVYALALQPDGMVIVGGAFQTFDGVSRPGIVRLQPSGFIDTTFNPGDGVRAGLSTALGVVYSIRLQPDGWILVGGDFGLYNTTTRANLARLHTDGTLDTSFLDIHYNQTHPGSDGFVNSISLQADGNVVIGGSFTLAGGGADYVGVGGTGTNAIRNQFNFTRLIGGNNPTALNMPGNVEFTSVNYSVDEYSLSSGVGIVFRRLRGEVGPIRATYYTVDGTARAGIDYVATTGTVAWAACDMDLIGISIPILDNTFVEGNRTFSVVVTDPVSIGGVAPSYPALGAQTRALITVVDDDFNHGALGFSQPVFSVNENGANATVTVIRTNGSVGQVTVQYATYDLTATSNSVNGLQPDYTQVSGTLTFSSGQTNRTITIPINNDGAVEFEDWFGIRLFNATNGATLGLSQATVLINDNDNGRGSVSFSRSDYPVAESNGTATITLRRNSGGNGTLSVDFIAYELPLVPGVARAEIDFVAVTNRVTFNPGVLTQFVTVPILTDRFVEGDERIGLVLTNVNSGSAIGFMSSATLTIVDDDSYGSISFGDVNFFVSERGSNATIALLRTGGDAEEVSVDFSATGLTATHGLDFIGTNFTVVFPDGVTTATVVVPILNDELLEGNETISVVMNNPQKATLGAFPNAVLTIIDDEALNSPSGSVDTGFEAHPNSFVNALGLQSNGKLIIGGDFTSINSFTYNRVARLNLNGGTDPLFKVGGGANDQIQAILVQPDDKIIIGGRFTTYDTTNRARIARLNDDGTIDSSFNPGSGADNPVFALAFAPDQRIVLGGSFTTVNGVTRPNVAVLNTNGSVDLFFNTGAGINGTVYAVAVQPDGKIIIGGEFTMVNNTNRTRIARLNPNGSLDLSFNPGGGAIGGAVRALLLQADGKVVMGGSFTDVNGTPRNYIARLNANGSVDASFDPGTGAEGAVFALDLAPNDRIVAAGDFNRFNGVSRNRITRLNSDGSTDPTINFGTGANSFIAAVLVQPDEQIVIGGGFTEFNGFRRDYVARLIGGENSSAGTFNFIEGVFAVDENGTNALVTVVRNGGTVGTATVSFQTFDGSATSPQHYLATNGMLVFPPGETLQSFTVPVVNNASAEGDVVLYISLSNPSPGADLGLGADAAILIREDDSVIAFTTENYSVNEGAAGAHATIWAERTGSTSSTVSAVYTTAAGSATEGNDYSETTGIVVFAPGETLKAFTIPVIEDLNVESPETVLLTLSDATVLSNPSASVYLGLADATLTIVDNDFLPGEFTLTVVTNVVNEQDAFVTITVLRTNGSSGIVSVHYALSGGTATPGLDYVATSSSLSFADGETAKSFTVLIFNDQIVEGDESAFVVLSNPTGGATLGAITNGVVIFVDDESGVQFESANYGVAEDDGSVRITVLRSGNTNVSASVGYRTAPGTATAPADYTSTNGVLDFAPGVTRRSFDVFVFADAFTEGPETFSAILQNPSPNVQIGSPSNAVITLQDSARFVHFSTDQYEVDEGSTNAEITIVRSGLLTRGISVIFRTADASAITGLDFLYTSNIVKFAAGESNKTVFVPIIDDGLTEGPESLLMELVSPTNAAVIAPSNAVLTILDNDT
ncbi:MAG TPA: Calx-beta domain-containing protein, partial [Candidatus Acidoferrum sp.]|nr:Calx-beta domain-containing protein [Candidatus Acidoferrum sp.]